MLTDTFGRFHDYLRISVTERCNLRCRYCMPPEGVPVRAREEVLTFEEIERVARVFVGAGVRKIRLTGGEPLVRKNVDELIERIGAIEGLEDLALTTNGLLLEPRLERLRSAGVNQLNISLDTLREDRFQEITLRPGLDKVLSAIDRAMGLGFSPVKVNCVMMRGINDDEVLDFVAWTRHLPLEVRFIEFMPFAGNAWHSAGLVPDAELIEHIREHHPDFRRLDDGPHATSKTYRVKGFEGTVGFISSMTDAFCPGCNRLRITADGKLMVCLFGRAGVSLRDAMREGASDAQLSEMIEGAVLRKKAAHDGMLAIASDTDRPMILIGG